MPYQWNNSVASYEDKLSIFAPPFSETAVETVEWISYRPINQITQGSVIEFSVPPTSSAYLDLSRTKLYIKGQILNKDNQPIKTENVALVNNPLASLFNQIDVTLQQQNISSGMATHYSYKAMIDILLTASEDRVESALTSQLVYKDSSNHLDDSDSQSGANVGLLQRAWFTSNGKFV